MMPRSLVWRTTVRFAALVTLTMALALVAGGYLLDRQMRLGLTLLHQGEANELMGMLDGCAPTAEAVRARVRRDSQGDAEWFFIQIHDGSGNILFRSANLGAATLPDLGQEEERRVIELPGVGGVQMSEVRRGPWHIQVGSPLANATLLLKHYAQVGALLTALAAVAGLGLGYAFSRFTLHPLRSVADTARRIRGDNLRERIPVPDTGDELAEVVGVLNETFDRLEASLEQARQFSADASHELKTPLALMRLGAERLRTEANDAKTETAADELLEAVSRMQVIVERLLFLARAEGGGLALQFRRVDVPSFLQAFAEDAAAVAEDAGVRFELSDVDGGAIDGDAPLLRQLLLNLVTNAVRVAPQGSPVVLTARHCEGCWRLAVEDSGPGLPPEELERIFRRFVRYAATAGSGRDGREGHGLGLSICRSIARLHRGQVHAENRVGARGLRVVLELPG